MTSWLRYRFDEEDTLSYYEVGRDGYTRRQVDLRGPDRLPVAAAVLDEVLAARDRGGIVAVRDYENRYGVVAEGASDEWRGDDRVVEIDEAEFEPVWTPARRFLDHGAPDRLRRRTVVRVPAR